MWRIKRVKSAAIGREMLISDFWSAKAIVVKVSGLFIVIIVSVCNRWCFLLLLLLCRCIDMLSPVESIAKEKKKKKQTLMIVNANTCGMKHYAINFLVTGCRDIYTGTKREIKWIFRWPTFQCRATNTHFQLFSLGFFIENGQRWWAKHAPHNNPQTRCSSHILLCSWDFGNIFSIWFSEKFWKYNVICWEKNWIDHIGIWIEHMK